MVLKPEVLIYNLDRQRIPSKRFFCSIIKKSLVVLKEKKRIALSLIFIDSRSIRRLNNYWRRKDKETTVLSFPLNEDENILGDIFFCPEEIKKQAKIFEISINHFYQKLVVHSLLHLYGYTHGQMKNQLKMERLEDKIIDAIDNKLIINSK
jgi:probable rRNA maturation factor